MPTIFYSWQSDLDTKTCRNFIERALLKAIEQIQDAELEDADRPLDDVSDGAACFPLATGGLILDKDTVGIPGSPPIAETIFKKIEQAALFVPDLTSVARRRDGRLCSNPNVLIEYGWALRCLSNSRIVPVMNTAYGAPTATNLPFDMVHLRHPITYHCPADATDAERLRERDVLVKKLRPALQLALGAIPKDVLPAPLPFASPYADTDSRFSKSEIVGRLHNTMRPMVSGEDPVLKLRSGPSMWLRLMPELACELDIGSRAIEEVFRRDGLLCLPLNRRGDARDIHYVRGEEGFGACSDAAAQGANRDEETTSLLYAMSSGEVWSIDTTHMLDTNVTLVSQSELLDALRSCASLLSRLGVAPNYRWVAGAVGLKNRQYVEWQSGNRGGRFLKDSVVESGLFDGNPDNANAALEPFLRALRRAAHMN